MQNGLAIYAGGNHIFYILGVLKRFIEEGLKFDAIGTYSAGAAILPFIIDQNFDKAVDLFSAQLEANKKNVYFEHIFSSKKVFPHDDIYSRTIDEIVDFEKTRTYGKPLRVIVSEFKSLGRADGAVGTLAFVAMLLNCLQKGDKPSIFLSAFKRVFSITGEVIDIRSCGSKEEIENIILGSSTIYPFIRLRRRGDRTMLDGKVGLNTPINALADCEHVLSVHAHHTFLPNRHGLVSISPLMPVKAGPLNYVGSAEIKDAYLQGYEEGKTHRQRLLGSPFF